MRQDARTLWLQLVVFGVFFGVGSCQDYNFEELPASVINEVRVGVSIHPAKEVDILFVLDNSGSMVGEQRQLAASFKKFSEVLDTRVEKGYRIAMVTTGMESRESDAVRNDQNQALLGCPPCSSLPAGTAEQSCINSTGETGRFQDRLGQNTGTDDAPNFVFSDDPTCRIVTQVNKNCFYDPTTQKGMVMVGTNGCGYEKGLAAMKSALGDLASSYNKDFLRPGATLAVILISDEEDCGERGDVMESTDARGDICYYGAKGQDRDGKTSYKNPNTGQDMPYKLTPVKTYYDFLMGLKNNEAGMVKFAAIVGVIDKNNPYTTTPDKIEFVQPQPGQWQVKAACDTQGCTGKYCSATPGTRYVELARLFGNDAFVDSICQSDFNDTMVKIAERISCPKEFNLSEPIRDPALANILINGEPIPRNSCSASGALIECKAGSSCPQGSCVETWVYSPPTAALPGGKITFAPHYDPCEIYSGKLFNIELVYVTAPKS
jgi:hypothetical protein